MYSTSSALTKRDEAISRYEKKCRKIKKYAKSISNHRHDMSVSLSEGRRKTRVIKRTTSSSNHVNEKSHEHSHGHESHEQSHGHESSGHDHGHDHAHGIVTEE